MAQQWAENNSEIAFEIVCSLEQNAKWYKEAKYLSLIHWKEFVLSKIIWLHATWTIKFGLILVTLFLLILALSTIFLPLNGQQHEI